MYNIDQGEWIMNNDLIYLIGEVIAMEIEEVENVSYGDKSGYLRIETKNGMLYEICFTAL